jgi:hypothetical protein
MATKNQIYEALKNIGDSMPAKRDYTTLHRSFAPLKSGHRQMSSDISEISRTMRSRDVNNK